MHSRVFAAKAAAVIACSAALVASPAVALAASGGAASTSQIVATQTARDSHTLVIENYDSSQTEASLLAKLRGWWLRQPLIGSAKAYDHYRLTSGSTVYNANANDDALTLHSGTYTVDGGYDRSILGTAWTKNVGTFVLERRWTLNVNVACASVQKGGIVATTTHMSGTTLNDSDTASVYEGEGLTFTTVPVDGYAVTSVTVDGAVITPGENGTYTVAARDGKDQMKNSTVKVTYKKTLIPDPHAAFVTYDPSARDASDFVLTSLLKEGAIPLFDQETGEPVEGLTADDFELTAPADALNAGTHTVSVTYKGTVAGEQSDYDAATFDATIVVEPLKLQLSWNKQIGSALALGDVSGFDFGASRTGAEDLGVNVAVTFYAGDVASEDAKLAAAPSEPGTYTEVATLTDGNGNIVAEDITRTFTVSKKVEPVNPAKPDSGNKGSTAKKKSGKKAKAALPATGDTSLVAPFAAGIAGVAALGSAVVAGEKRRND